MCRTLRIKSFKGKGCKRLYEVVWVELQLGKQTRRVQVVLVEGLPSTFVLGMRDIQKEGLDMRKAGYVRVWNEDCRLKGGSQGEEEGGGEQGQEIEGCVMMLAGAQEVEEVEVLTRMKTEGICRVEGRLVMQDGGEGKKTRVLLDTGASRSFIAERIVQEHGRRIKICGERAVNARVKGFADGITQSSKKAVQCVLGLGEVEKEVEALVVKDMTEEFILGIRELREGGLRITEGGAEVWGEKLRKWEDLHEENSSDEDLRRVYGSEQRELVEEAIKDAETKWKEDGEMKPEEWVRKQFAGVGEGTGLTAEQVR